MGDGDAVATERPFHICKRASATVRERPNCDGTDHKSRRQDEGEVEDLRGQLPRVP